MKALALLIVLASLSAHARVESLCQRAYKADSYGRGIEQGFTGNDTAPRFLHSQCFQIGISEGIDLKGRSGMFCSNEFEAGYEQGVQNSWFGIGTECYNAGYKAGLALLGTLAREGRADQVCLDYYAQGFKDGTNGREPNGPSDHSAVSHCYSTGFADSDPRP